jgi:hypothetical protein
LGRALKFLNTQIEQWLGFQQDYINSVMEFYGKFPGWNGNSKNTDSYFKYPLALKKSYIDSVRATLDSFTKQNLELIQKNIEKASSLFDSYLNLFRVQAFHTLISKKDLPSMNGGVYDKGKY